MKHKVTTGLTLAATTFLVLTFSPNAAAQPKSTGSPSQDCKQFIEPIFQSLGLPMGHSTCVTLLNGAGKGDVSICKFGRDIGAITNDQYGQCVSSHLPAGVLLEGIYSVVFARHPSNDQILALYYFSQFWGAANNYDFGPTGISIAAFAGLLTGLFLVQRYRGKAPSGVSIG